MRYKYNYSAYLQHPTTEHVLTGSDAEFSCVVSHASSIRWYVYFPDDTFDKVLHSSTEGVIRLSSVPSGNIVNTSITINARPSWNNTILRCHAVQGSAGSLSNPASLIIYTSLRNQLIHCRLVCKPISFKCFVLCRTPSTIKFANHVH